MIVELNSVASVVDDRTFIVYPKYQDGSYDQTSGVKLSGCVDRWKDILDEWDKEVVKHLLDIEKNRKH